MRSKNLLGVRMQPSDLAIPEEAAPDTAVRHTHKQVLVLRKDLNMRKGKMVAQGAHASQIAVYPRPTDEDIVRGYMIVPLTEHNIPWLRDNFKKITCGVKDENELLTLYERAKELGIPCSLVTDSGLTEFHNVPTNTAIAVGPAHEDIVNLVTGHLTPL